MKNVFKRLNLQTVLIFVIVFAMIEFLTVSFISFNALKKITAVDQSSTLIILIAINLSMVALFIFIMFLVLRAFKRINYFAFYSSITGLPNKNFVLNNLVDEISHFKEFSALMSLDMDNFKAVNDSLGHLMGDKMLKHAGRRFKNVLNIEDCVCHIGGDEFLFFIRYAKNKENIEKIAREIIDSFKTPFHLDGRIVDYVSASLGIALIPDDGKDFQTVFNCADDAMYSVKKLGKNNYQFYNSSIKLNIYEDAVKKKAIEGGIKNREFKVFYQPKVSASGKLIGAEALVRWFKSDGTIQPPSEFIDFAERNGLISEISDIVIEEVCSKILNWIDKGYRNFSISINLTAEHLINDVMCKGILDKIKAYNVPSEYIEFEITESIIIKDFNAVIKNTKMIRNFGVKISLDDFGTGYSSLNYLKNLPVDIIKLDKSFIDSIAEDEKDRILLKSIINISHSFGYVVVAEGVEQKEQYDILNRMNCDIFQGYYFGKPMEDKMFETEFLSIK